MGCLFLRFLGYFQARIGNLIWNNTTLDKLSFKSSLRARDFFWLYFQQHGGDYAHIWPRYAVGANSYGALPC